MFSRVFDFFKGEASLEVDQSGEPTPEDMMICTGVLLLEMAGVDADYDPEEVHTVFRAMEQEFSIDQDQTLKLLEMADTARGEQGKIDEFVKAINERFTDEQKIIVLSMVWKVVLADGKIDKYERRFATQLKFRLKLTDEQSEDARHRAERSPVD